MHSKTTVLLFKKNKSWEIYPQKTIQNSDTMYQMHNAPMLVSPLKSRLEQLIRKIISLKNLIINKLNKYYLQLFMHYDIISIKLISPVLFK